MNLLLRQLAAADRTLLERNMEVQAVATGTVLTEVGESIDSVVFPVDSIISIEQSAGIEVAIVGREGMFGWSAIASYQPSPFRAVARGRDGRLLKIPVEVVISAMTASAQLRSVMCQYLVVLAVQMGETIASQGLHRLDARIARWLLMRHDRVGGDEIRAQHVEIADSLGARRASITDCLHIIEGDGHIRCRRGRISIRSRRDLEHMASGCYGAAEACYASSLGPFAKVAGVQSPSFGGGTGVTQLFAVPAEPAAPAPPLS